MDLGKKLAEGFAVDSAMDTDTAEPQTGPIEIVPADVTVTAEAPAEPTTV